jgi:hypothetical protein
MMTRDFKILSIAFALTLASSAVVASAALAGEFHFSAESTILTGEAVNSQLFEVTPGGNKFTCKKVSVTESTMTEKTTEKVTLKPKYEECEALHPNGQLAAVANIELTSCAYSLTAKTEAEHAKLRIECPNEGEDIHIKATALKLTCVDIPPQEVGGVHYKNTGETTETEQKTLDVEATISGIVMTTKNSVACPSENEVHNNGSYNGIFKLKGDNTINEPTDVSYS